MPSVPLNRYFVFFGLAIFGCALDLWTKHAMFAWLGTPPTNSIWWVVEGYFGFETALNTGAVFGMGQGKFWLFAAFSVVAALGILYVLFIARAAHDALLNFALGGITGGILGNLYDRLGLWGGQTPEGEPIYAVRDWILFRYGQYTWPNFNIADMLLVGGAILLVWHAFRKRPASPETAEKVADEPAT